MKRFLFFILVAIAFVIYLFDLDDFLSKHFKIFASLKSYYIENYIEYSQKIKNHFEHEKLIKTLQDENLELKEYKILYNTTISKIDNLKDFLINVEIPNIESQIEIIKVLSYISFDDFTSVWLDKVPTNNNIFGLISENYAAGISLVKNGKSIGLLNGNRDCTYAVFIGNEKSPGIVSSHDDDPSLLAVRFIPVWADIKIGDEVITSGLDNIFYEGLKVGKVTDIKEYPDMKMATIKPYSNPLKKRFFYAYKASSKFNEYHPKELQKLQEQSSN